MDATETTHPQPEAPAMSKSPRNDPSKAGALAGRKVLFGDYSRFAVAPVHTRSDAVEWFVWDAYVTDEVTGLPAVVRQESTREAAVSGL